METKPFSLQAPEEIAKEYGGNKQKIAQAAQSGLLDPTAAVLAGMFIDRMRNAQGQEQAPVQTVAQDVMGAPPPPQGMPPGAPQGMPPGAPPVPQGMPQGASPAPQGIPQAGLEALPVPDEMFGMAGGGLVAFADGGLSTNDLKRLMDQRTVSGGMTAEDSAMLNRIFGGEQYNVLKNPNIEMEVSEPQPSIEGSMPTFTGGDEYGVSPETMVTREPTPYVEAPIIRGIENIQKTMSEGPYAGIFTSGRGAAREQVGDEAAYLADSMTNEPANVGDEAGYQAESMMGQDQGNLAALISGTQLPGKKTAATTAATMPTGGGRSMAEGRGDSALDRYTRMLEGSIESSQKERDEARNMALLQAGLAIMGGTSSNALQNIAMGALPATQSYQRQVSNIKDRDLKTMGALADLELKSQELGITAQRYQDLAEIGRMQALASLSKSTGELTEKDYRKAIFEATQNIMKNDITVSAEDAVKIAKDQVDAIYGLNDSKQQTNRRSVKFSDISN